MADPLSSFANSPLMAVIIGGAVLVIIFFKLGGKFGKKSQIITRAEVIRKRLITTLAKNKTHTMVLKQKGNLIGIVKNIGAYPIQAGKVFIICYYPKILNVIPAIWEKNILIVDGKYLKEEKESLIKGRRQVVPVLHLADDFFIDTYFNCGLNFMDQNAVAFMTMVEGKDKDEVRSSISLAQGLRLTSVDPNKPFNANETPASVERRYEEVQKA